MPTNHETRYILTAQDKTGREFARAESGMAKLGTTARSLQAAFVSVAGAVGLGAVIKSTVESTRQTVAYSEALGISTEALTQWQFAAASVGLEADKVGDIMKDTSEKIGDAFRNDAGEAKEALESMGLSISAIAQLSPDQQLLAIAGGLEEVATQGEKVQILEAIANDASLLIPLLDDGAAGFKEMAQQADVLGVTLTKIEADEIKKADEAIRIVEASFQSLGQELTVLFAPAMQSVIRQLGVVLPEVAKIAQDATTGIFDFLFESEAFTSTTMEEALSRRIELESQLANAREMGLERFIPKIETEIDRNELLIDTLERKRGIIEENAALEVVITESVFDNSEALRQRELDAVIAHQDAMTEEITRGVGTRTEWEKKSTYEKTKFIFADLENVTRGVAQHNRKLFEINKVAGIANAIINTYEGVSETLSTYPMPYAGVMAAIHLAAGLAQVAAIESTSFGGGGAAPSLSGSGGGAGAPVSTVPAIDQQSDRPTVQVFINGSAVGDEGVRNLVVEAVETAIDNDELRRR